ncbi:hypothetical protein B7463_g10334, partial [Scytalidium lignicola]
MARSPRTVQFLIILFVTFGSITYGYCASIIATTLAQPSFVSYFSLDKRPNTTQLEGAINGLFQTGGLFGALSCSQTADLFGRRKALFIGGACALVGGALQAGSVHIAMFIVARLLAGLGSGALVTLVPLYQSEIAPPAIRGLLVGTHGVVIVIGYITASWIGFGFYFVNASGAQWRIPLAIQCLPPLALISGVMFVPESPRWLILRDRIDEAYIAYTSTRAEITDTNNADETRSQFNLMHSQILHEKQNAITWKDMFTHPTLRFRCFLGFITLFACQATGTQVINNYGPLLYKRLGYDTVLQLLIQSCWITVCPLGNVFNALVVDRIGRVRLLIFGFTGTTIALIGECITVSIFQRTQDTKVASAAVFFLFFHIGCYGVSLDATSYIYASEIFPTPARAKGLAISLSGLFSACIIFLSAAPTAFTAVGWKYYLVFVIFTAIMIVIVYLYFPETSKKTLEELGAVFGDTVEGLTKETEDDIYRRLGHHKDHHPDAVANEEKEMYKHDVDHVERF